MISSKSTKKDSESKLKALVRAMFAAILTLMLAISLFACGDSGSSGSGSNGGDNSDNSTTNGDNSSTNDNNANNTDSSKDDQQNNANKEPTLGSTVEFDDLELTFGTEISTTTVNNQFSEQNGQTVIVVPVTVTNKKSETHSLNMFYIKTFGSTGTETKDITAYFMDDDVSWAGDLRSGASYETSFHILYDGDGDYYIVLDNFKKEVEIVIPVKIN